MRRTHYLTGYAALCLAVAGLLLAGCTTRRLDYQRADAAFRATGGAMIGMRRAQMIGDTDWEGIYQASVLVDDAMDVWHVKLMALGPEPTREQLDDVADAERKAVAAVDEYNRRVWERTNGP